MQQSVGKKKRVREEGKPKAALNPFLVFAQAERSRVKEQFGLDTKETAKKLGELWNALPDESKKGYVDESNRLKEKYKVDLATFQEAKKKKAEEELQKQPHRNNDGTYQISIDVKEYECPICMEVIETATACSEGHLVCTACYDTMSVKKCPTCRKPMQMVRQREAERIAAQLPRGCKFTGCEHTSPNLLAMQKHMEECPRNPANGYTCTTCQTSFASKEELIAHMKESSRPLCRVVNTLGSFSEEFRQIWSMGNREAHLRARRSSFMSTLASKGDRHVMIRVYFERDHVNIVAKEVRKSTEESSKLGITVSAADNKVSYTLGKIDEWKQTWDHVRESGHVALPIENSRMLYYARYAMLDRPFTMECRIIDDEPVQPILIDDE